MNSKRKFGKRTKQPIDSNNFNNIENSLFEAISFLKSLKDTNEVLVIQGPRKTFAIGLCFSTNSILEISRYLLDRQVSPFAYIPKYRFSQDTIEMFSLKFEVAFGGTTIQQHFNSNMLEITATEKKIESPCTANCSPQTKVDNIDTSSGMVDPAVHHLLLSSNVWRADVLYYISGFVVKKVIKSIDGPDCVSALCDNSSISTTHDHLNPKSLFNCKQYGNLMLPSDSVYRAVACVDKISTR